MTSLMVGGLALAGLAVGGRMALRHWSKVQKMTSNVNIPNMPHPKTFLDMKGYYKGGFEPTMSKAEAARILGINTSSPKNKVKEAHKRLMLINHPDRGGSKYFALKINEAKNMMEK